jgi:LysR family transcriptional regulator, transcriptional activator of nhaA
VSIADDPGGRVAWLNYHHLLYFWTVARLGSIARATEELHLTQPAISAQLRTLERALGEKLFAKSGRNLVLTDVGRLVFRYADEIFTTGRELQETLAGRPTGRPVRFTVGVADAMPKLLSYRLLEPALRGDEPVRLVLREDKPERLLADLAIHALDLVLADAPVPPAVKVRAHSHLLGECGVTFFAAPALARVYRRRFPRSLDGAPFLLPIDNSVLRRSLDQWFEAHGVRPRAVAELEDSAVLKVFGQSGVGLFAAPTAVEADVRRQYGVRVVGRTDEIRERFYAISAERKVTHPAVLAITRAARRDVFG